MYTLIAAVFTFKFGPDFIKEMNDVGNVYQFDRINRIDMDFRSPSNTGLLQLGDSTITVPIRRDFDTASFKPRYLEVALQFDTLNIQLVYDWEKHSDKRERLVDFLEKKRIIDKIRPLAEQLPITFTTPVDTEVKVVLDEANDFRSRDNYLTLDKTHVYGTNSRLRYFFGKAMAYLITICSALALILIVVNGYLQYMGHHKKGKNYYAPSWGEGIKTLFGKKEGKL